MKNDMFGSSENLEEYALFHIGVQVLYKYFDLSD